MAGEWIAMRHDLWECPQVVRILSAMCPQDVRNVSARVRIMGALYRTWCLIDRFADDGILHGYTAETLDAEVDIPGWSENLQQVGWLVIEPQHLVIPEFESHFGCSAKRRMQDAKRKRVARQSCPQSVRTPADKKRTTEQKRTEEDKKKETPLPPSLQTDEFRAAWIDWQRHRAEIKKRLTPTQMTKQLKTFQEWGEVRSIAAINHTIEKGWQGIREPDSNGHASTTKPKETLLQKWQKSKGLSNGDSK